MGAGKSSINGKNYLLAASMDNNTVMANRTFSSVKPSISPSNVALNVNPGTVLKSACPEDSKTPPTW